MPTILRILRHLSEMNKNKGSLLIEILVVLPFLLSISYALLTAEKLSVTEIVLASQAEEITEAKKETLSLLSGGLSVNNLLSLDKPYIIKIISHNEGEGFYVLSIETHEKKEQIYWHKN